MRRFVTGFLAAFAAAIFAIAAPVPKASEGSDWLEFRGPNGTGHYVGSPLPTAWGPDKNVAWKTPIPGAGWSSPILVRGKLIFTTAVVVGGGERPDHELRAVCIDSKSGKIDWNEQVFLEKGTTPRPHSKNGHASPTPVSDGERIIVHFGHMGTATLDLTGKVLWKNDKHPYAPVHGNGGSPILVEGNVVFACDGADKPFVLALDAKTGAEAWKTERNSSAGKKFAFTTAQLIEQDGKKVIVSVASDFVAGYDPKTGKEVWRAKYPGPGYSVIGRPLYSHGLVIFTTGYDSPRMLAVKPSGTGDITDNIVWQATKGAPNTPTPIIVGDELYLVSDQGMMTCLDAATGKQHWSSRMKGGAYSSSPIFADGKIIVVSESGVVQIVRPNMKELEVVGEADMKEKTYATPVPADGALYVRTATALFKFAEKK